jgi:WD40 repeat protein
LQSAWEKDAFTRAIRDSERFILQFFDCIQESAMHLYHSALPQSPKNSDIHAKNSDIHNNLHPLLGGGTTVRKGLELDWKAKTRTIVTRLQKVASLKFSTDGSKVAAGGDGGLQVFDTTTGECLATMPAPEKCISVEFSHDASFLLTTYADHGIRLWDVQTGGFIRTCKGHESRIWDCSFSPRGTHFASVDELGHIRVWNIENGDTDHTFKADSSATRIFCKWSSESTLITHSSPSGGTFWHDIPSGTSAFHRYPAKTGVSILNNTHNGLYIVERDRDHLRIFDAVTLELLKFTHDIPFPTQPTTQGFQNMDLQIASLSLDEHHFVSLKPLNELRLYRISTDSNTTAFALQAATSIYHSSPITSAFFSSDSSQIAFGSEDGTIILSSLATNYDDSKPTTAITCVCTSPDRKLCAYANKRGVIEVCSILTGAVTKSITAGRIWRDTEIENMAFSPRNEFLAIHYKKIVTMEGNQHVRLGLLIWDIVFDRKYSQPELLIPTTSISPRCTLQYFEGYERKVAGLAAAFSVPT